MFSFGRICFYNVSNKDKKEQHLLIFWMLEFFFFTAVHVQKNVGEKFCHPKTPILGQKWLEIHFSPPK